MERPGVEGGDRAIERSRAETGLHACGETSVHDGAGRSAAAIDAVGGKRREANRRRPPREASKGAADQRGDVSRAASLASPERNDDRRLGGTHERTWPAAGTRRATSECRVLCGELLRGRLGRREHAHGDPGPGEETAHGAHQILGRENDLRPQPRRVLLGCRERTREAHSGERRGVRAKQATRIPHGARVGYRRPRADVGRRATDDVARDDREHRARSGRTREAAALQEREVLAHDVDLLDRGPRIEHGSCDRALGAQGHVRRRDARERRRSARDQDDEGDALLGASRRETGYARAHAARVGQRMRGAQDGETLGDARTPGCGLGLDRRRLVGSDDQTSSDRAPEARDGPGRHRGRGLPHGDDVNRTFTQCAGQRLLDTRGDVELTKRSAKDALERRAADRASARAHRGSRSPRSTTCALNACCHAIVTST